MSETAGAIESVSQEDQGGGEAEGNLASNPEFLKQFNAILGSGDGEEGQPTQATPVQTTTTATKAPQVDAAIQEQQPDKTQEAKATLTAALRQAAKRNGYEDAEIDRLYAADPELATKSFSRLYEAYNRLSEDYARLGQANVAAIPTGQGQGQPTPQQNVQQPTIMAELNKVFDQKSLQSLAETQGQEFVDNFIMPLKRDLIDPVSKLLGKLQAQEDAQVQRDVATAFKGWEGDFGDVYGPADPQQRTALHQRNRLDVAREAEWIYEGAQRSGIDMPVGEALERAHERMFGKDRIAVQERKKLTSAVQSRSQQITARPSNRRGAEEPVGDAAAEAAYKAKAGEIGLLR
jgi:hypothetical protein